MKHLLEVKNLTVNCKYAPILQNINFRMQPGEVIAIVGQSGCGKSTLLRTVMGLLPAHWQIKQGEILFNGIDILNMSAQQLRTIRGSQIGMVFQNSAAMLCPTRRIGDQIYEAFNAHKKYSRDQSVAAAVDMFTKLNLPDPKRILNSYPFELSGGMNQRVGIALAMLLTPELLLTDEPTSALDVVAQAQVMHELAELRRQTNTAIIFVTHNIALAASFADRIIVMRQGEIIEQNSSYAVMHAPQADYTRELIAAVPYINRSQYAADIRN